MKGDNSGIVTLLVLLGLALVGVVLWKKGIFEKLGAFLTSPAKSPNQNPGVAGGIGPTEYGQAAPGGGSAFGRVCNQVTQTAGQIAQKNPDPRSQAAGIATQALGPLACATAEYAAGKVWDGTKWVAGNAGKGVSTAAKATASGVKTGAKAAWDNTLGRLF